MQTAPRKELSLFDSTCIIVGIIVGAGIYKTPPLVAASMGSWAGAVGIWLVGGLLALAGALCYAELATAFPREGGDYVYLGNAYGPWAGYLFSWAQTAIIRPGDIALMAFVFGSYAQTLYAPLPASRSLYAVGAIVVFTAINVLGVKQGKWTQNLLTVLKALGLVAILALGLFGPGGQAPAAPGEAAGLTLGGFRLALILVLFTFGGWHEMAYVAAEVKQPRRNILRALLIGTVAVTVLYVLVNGAYLRLLGYGGMCGSGAVAVDAVATVLPDLAGRAIAVLVILSVLGAVNGLVFTGARISYALGTGHAAFRPLGRWNARLGTPVWALLLQGVLSSAIVLLAGSFVETIIYTAPVFWLFFLATGASVFVLRLRRRDVERPYKVTGYPVTPIVFCACCVFMIYSAVSWAVEKKPIGLCIAGGVLVLGGAAYVLTDVLGLGGRNRPGGGPANGQGQAPAEPQ